LACTKSTQFLCKLKTHNILVSLDKDRQLTSAVTYEVRKPYKYTNKLMMLDSQPER